MSDELVAIAVIRRAIGLQGFVGLDALGKTFRSLKLPAVVLIGKDKAHCREAIVIEMGERPKGPVALFEGCTDRTCAELMEGLTVFIERSKLPQLENQRFYQFELVGMKVYTTENDYVGTVLDVINFPTVDSIEVDYKNDSVFIPLTDESLTAIDRDKRTIVINKEFLEEML
jgi:16S rRNA processing protein RimM